MSIRKQFLRTTARGVTLLELLLVLVLIIVIMLAIGGYYAATNNARLTSQAYDDVQVIANACQGWWEDKGHTFAGISLKELVDAGYLSDSYESTPWGGGGATVGKVDDQTVQITFSQTPWKVCNALTIRILGAAAKRCIGTTPPGPIPFTVCMDGNKNYAACSSPS